MTIRDLIPWNRSREVAVRRGEEANPFLTLHREMNRLFNDVFRSFDVRRQGLQFIVQGADSPCGQDRLISDLTAGKDSSAALDASRRRFEWMERTLSPDLIRHGCAAGRDPGVVVPDFGGGVARHRAVA